MDQPLSVCLSSRTEGVLSLSLSSGGAQAVADALGLSLITSHIYEILIVLSCYHLIYLFVGPAISARLFPTIYPQLSSEAKSDWDIHIVSLTQCTLISVLSSYIVLFDERRKAMTWPERVWGYTEMTNTVLAVANGYFIWHLSLMIKHRKKYGWPMVAHAVCTLFVMMLGFRPAFNYYGASFLLYEISSIPLNLHRYILKLGWEGSRTQLINGFFLLVTFGLCRVVWGTYQSLWFWHDMVQAIRQSREPSASDPNEKLAHVPYAQTLPMWLVGTHFCSNTVLNILNFIWFSKIVNTLRRRLAKSTAERPPPKQD